MKKKGNKKIVLRKNRFRKSWIITLTMGMIFGVFTMDINAIESTYEVGEVSAERIVEFLELEEPIKNQKIEVGGEYSELKLPTEISAQFSVNDEIIEKDIAVTWNSEPAFDSSVPGKYMFHADIGSDYVLAEGVKLPSIEIAVVEKNVLTNTEDKKEKGAVIIDNFAATAQVDVSDKTVSAIQNEIMQAIKKNKKVEVIGVNESINGTLTLSLKSGEELIWNAEYQGVHSKNNMMVIEEGGLFSEGSFIIGSNAIIKGKKTGSVSNNDVMISSHVDVAVKPGAQVISENSATIRLEDLYDKIIVDGGTIISNSAFATIDAPSVMTALSDKVTIKGNAIVQNTGAGLAIYSHSGYVRVEGGQVLATTKEAIRMDGFFASTILSGGVVFAYGKNFEGENQVIDNFWGSFDVKQTGTVIAYDKPKGSVSYAYGSTTNIKITPKGATAVWSLKDGQSGIAYSNKNNSGFIPVDVTVEKLPLTMNDFTYTIPTDDRYNEQKQGLKDVSCTQADYLTSGGNITLVYKQDGKEVEPINAGSYEVYLSASGSNLYVDVVNAHLGTYTIKKAKELNVSWPNKATDIVYGDKLMKSMLQDATHKYGTFEWVSPQTRYHAGIHGAGVKFIANDLAILNYEKLPTDTKKVNVNVKKEKAIGLDKEFSIYAEYQHKYEVDLASLLPVLDNQLTYGKTTSALTITHDKGRILDQKATKINTKTGNVEIQSNQVKMTNNTAVIKIITKSQNYEDITSTITVKVINKKELNVSNIVIEKTYDGTKNSEVEVGRGGIKLIGIDKKDDVKVIGKPRAIFSKADVGTYNDIELNGLSLTGKDAGKYKLSMRGYSGTIKAKSISEKDVKIEIKDTNLTYDGNVKKPDVKITYNKMQLVEGKDYSITYNNNRNAGNNNAEMTITGKGNYTGIENKKFSIQKKKVTVDSIRANNREYDGTVHVQLYGGKLNGIIKQDRKDVDIKLGRGTLIGGKDASSKAKKVKIDVTIVGKKANNYEIDKNVSQKEAIATIRKRVLVVNEILVEDKIYDGTTQANVSKISFKRIVDKEKLRNGKDYKVTATFADEHVATNKNVKIKVDFSNKQNSTGKNYIIKDFDALASITAKEIKGNVTIDVNHQEQGNLDKIGAGDILVANVEQVMANDEAVTLAYQWYRNGEPIDNATKKEYTVQDQFIDEVGDRISVKISGINNYKATIESNIVEIDKLDLELDFDIQGNTRVNTTLKLNIKDSSITRRTLNFADKKYEIRWYRGTTEITDAFDATTYTIQMNDIGETLTVKIIGVGIYDGIITKTIPVVTPINPTEVENLTATPHDGKIVLKWDDPKNDGGIDLQKYEVSLDDGSWKNLDLNKEYTIAGLENNKTYTFKVRVTNNYGLTSTGSVVNGTPTGIIDNKTQQVKTKTITNTSDTTSVVTWLGMLFSSLSFATIIVFRKRKQ